MSYNWEIVSDKELGELNDWTPVDYIEPALNKTYEIDRYLQIVLDFVDPKNQNNIVVKEFKNNATAQKVANRLRNCARRVKFREKYPEDIFRVSARQNRVYLQKYTDNQK